MTISKYIHSDGFFEEEELVASPEMASFDSLRGRGLSLLKFLEQLAIAPLAFIGKIVRTSLAAIGVCGSILLLILTLCSSIWARQLFVRRIEIFAKELADWILWPVALATRLGKLLLAAFIHPALYFNF